MLKFIAKTVSRLPWGVLYLLADVFGFLAYYIIRYRRRVVRRNLSQALPEKSPAEIKETEKKFYRNFADLFAEVLKGAAMSDEEYKERITFDNLDIIFRHLEAGRSVAIYFSHSGCWEWGTAVALHIPPGSEDSLWGQVYHPLENKSADALMLSLRSRFDTRSYPMESVFRQLHALHQQGKKTVTAFIADQKPGHSHHRVNIMFLNQPTSFHGGAERLAAHMDMAAVYWDVAKTSRGHYRITTIPIADNVADCPPDAVTRRYAKLLETNILRQPEIWLWSHNRWKHPVTLDK